MMKSNVYLAFGQIGGVPVMKVGKANDLKRREKQLRIDVEFSLECVSEGDALVFEDQLREHALSLGASSFRGYDWFYYDDNVYESLKAILIEFGSEGSVLKLEQEIAQYQLKYYQMTVDDLELELFRKDRQISQRDEMIGNLREEIGMLKGIIKMMKEQDGKN